MAEQRKPFKKAAPKKGSAPRAAGTSSAAGSRGERTGRAEGQRKPFKRTESEGKRGGAKREDAKPQRRDGQKPPFRKAGERPAPRRERPAPERVERTDDQKVYDGPDIPAFIDAKDLDRSVAAQLKGLPDKLAARIARLLVAAGHFIDSDPELAYQYAKAAKSRTQRLAVIREALGEAAYAAGHYAEALSELRAAKRMNGATAYLPIMADCHRALGQPEQAIKLAQSPSVRNFIPEAKAEMTIVEAGARRDMGQFDAALRTLELAPLNHKSRASWVVRLRYAYADTLSAAGRLQEALEWFHRTYAVDGDEITDAASRAEELERLVTRD